MVGHADLALTLSALTRWLRCVDVPAERTDAETRNLAQLKPKQASEPSMLTVWTVRSRSPMAISVCAMQSLANALPDDVVVVDETSCGGQRG